MPKFKLEYELSLNDVLKALGMEVAFTFGANFTKIRKSGGIRINEVKHKTFVDVNEEGTAATSVGMIDIAHLSMIVNRPFVFLIREKFSNTILLYGEDCRAGFGVEYVFFTC